MIRKETFLFISQIHLLASSGLKQVNDGVLVQGPSSKTYFILHSKEIGKVKGGM